MKEYKNELKNEKKQKKSTQEFYYLDLHRLMQFRLGLTIDNL